MIGGNGLGLFFAPPVAGAAAATTAAAATARRYQALRSMRTPKSSELPIHYDCPTLAVLTRPPSPAAPLMSKRTCDGPRAVARVRDDRPRELVTGLVPASKGHADIRAFEQNCAQRGSQPESEPIIERIGRDVAAGA